MMIRRLLPSLLALLPATVSAQTAPPPKLLVVISVDQFSADLFAEYRPLWSGGMKRLEQGAVFPSGYQSHAATETCPGHSTILTGDHPARTGIIANTWIDQSVSRDDKSVYCAEDESQPGTTSRKYVPSAVHLRAATLGDRMKDANPAARIVAVAGKDRAAIMMGGHKTDAIWFLDPFKKRSFVTLTDQKRSVPADVMKANAATDRVVGSPAAPMALPAQCLARSRAIAVTPELSVGDGRFARKADDAEAFRASPALDAATLALAGDLIASMKLGKGPVTDLIAIGLSSTDYVGHRYGTEGSEMCIQLTALDAGLGALFRRLDKARIDYAVVLTADHGGHDLPERNREDALPEASRLDIGASSKTVGAAIGKELGIAGPVLRSADIGDMWIDKGVPANLREQVLARAVASFAAMPQVAAVYTAAQLAAVPAPGNPVEIWTPLERAAASFYARRSGDFVVLLKPRVTPIPEPGVGYVATHGSPWDYDRRVPMLFWRKGMTGFEQPNSVETIDIAPTLAAWIGMPINAGAMDGRCLDLIVGPTSMCSR
jgi:predicted AlkP superfamily pyrophosphatase or phosphodiesterase